MSLTCFGSGGARFRQTNQRRAQRSRHSLKLSLYRRHRPPKNTDGMSQILETIKSYPPGQQKVDRGGFSIVTSSPSYVYVQFESLKRGFKDDVEFALTSDGRAVQVRSSSRLGDLDLGVNAKRLNWVSERLREMGWEAQEITKDEYPDYFTTLVFTYDDYIRSVLSPKDCPVPAQPLDCRDPPI